MKEASKKRTGKLILWTVGVTGGAIGLWAAGAILFSLAQVNWQVSELLRSYLVAVGAIGEFATLVDFYAHIKGVEYIICAAFLVAFPIFFRYVNRPAKKEVTAR